MTDNVATAFVVLFILTFCVFVILSAREQRRGLNDAIRKPAAPVRRRGIALSGELENRP